MKTFPGYAWLAAQTKLWAEHRRVVAKVRAGQPLSQTEMMGFLGAPVHLHDLEIAALQKCAGQAPGPIVEIGAAFGGSALVFLLHKPSNATVCSIDPFVKDSMADFQASAEQCRRGVTRALKAAGMGKRASAWRLIPDYSHNAVKNFPPGIELLFIDGDHRYDAVKQDFDDWFPLVSKGGVILLHDSCRVPGTPDGDFNQGWPGPTQLAAELKRNPNVTMIGQVISLSIFRKNFA